MGNYNQDEADDMLWDVLLYIKEKYRNSAKLVTWENYEQEAQILIEIPVIQDNEVVAWGYIKLLADEILEKGAQMSKTKLHRCIDDSLRPYIKRFRGEND